LLFVIMQNAQKPSHMILTHCLIQNFLTVPSYSEWVLKGRLLAIFAKFITENLFIKFNSPRDRVMEPEIKSILFFEIWILLLCPKHSSKFINYKLFYLFDKYDQLIVWENRMYFRFIGRFIFQSLISQTILW
jgi:hypothetical protein